jgi:NADH-quinone oxidoreductase subunit I
MSATAHAPDLHAHGHAPETHGSHDELHASGPRKGKVSVKTVARPNSVEQAVYVPAIVSGLGVTMKHFFTNLFSKRKNSEIVTVQYPEEKVKYPVRYRGLHRLMTRDDGSVRCVACMCCPTVCPAHCITIVAEETGNGAEKRPKLFEIDELRCIVCGLCVEACPCDAIRMDTGVHMKPSEHRWEAVLGKTDLMSRGTLSLAVQGGIGAEWKAKQTDREQ